MKAAELAACDLGQATEVGYAAQRDAHKDPGQLGRWHVLQDVQPFQIRNSRRKSDPPIRLRRVFVHSTARAHAAATSRAKKLARAEDDLNRLLSGLGGRFYPTSRRSPPGSSRSPATARQAPTCATPSAPPGRRRPRGHQHQPGERPDGQYPRCDRPRSGGHLPRHRQRRTPQARPHLVV